MLPSCRDHHLGKVTQALFSPISPTFADTIDSHSYFHISHNKIYQIQNFLFFFAVVFFSAIFFIAFVFANLIESVATKAAFSFNSSPQMVRLRRLTSTTHLLWIIFYHMLNLNLKSDIPEVTFSKLPKTYLLGK